ncbi:hypothetical protein B0H17DRAFT_1103780 [Mycena rosella]|uniref:Uncharacterized protein n=1 Tax=Mycena rosella TaxID=1033263 RepID=A0AAD7FVW0_MYCRO|nr:hypothetical protein B0H17DRAFT_1103780 [Mycena rosella]
MSSKSASRKLSGPGAVSSLIPSLHGGPSDFSRTRRPAMNFGPVATLFTFLVLSCVIVPCRAEDPNRVFQWAFGGPALSTSLPACRTYPITVKPFNTSVNTQGIPPFYMLSFAVDATPTIDLLGTSEDNLNWIPTQPVGAKLMLEVVDSQGSSGGIPPSLYTITVGQNSNCIPPASTQPAFTVTANVTGNLNTCQPWGLTIKGGTPPYNITLAALNSPVTTNVTITPDQDAFTYINRADPGTQLIAAISDLNGRWATGTPIVTTVGSADTSCTGLVGGGGNSTQIAQQEQAAAAAAKSAKNKGVIAGAVVAVVVVLLLGAAGAFLYMRRRKIQQRVQEITPRQFEGGDAEPFEEINGGQILSINAFISPSSPTQPRSPKSPGASTVSNVMSSSNASGSGAMPGPYDRRRVPGAPESVASSGMGIRNPDRPAFTSFPTASVRRSAKEIEAGLPTGNSLHSDYSGDAGSDMSSRPLVERSQSAVAYAGPSAAPFPSRSASVGAPSAEIIFQHQDAGVVRELPPPYADRGPRDPES